MKRPTEIDDPSDRAQKWRKTGLLRISLDEIGFWDLNRGGLGISAHHVHEVAHDCMANKTKLNRYGHVDIVEIPAQQLESIRECNRDRAAGEDLLPKFSPNIKYVCGSKTHFVHAQKLARDGRHTLFNDYNTAVKWRDDDVEGHTIIAQGPVCAIYTRELFEDNAAMEALSSEDNLNAGVQLGEDEMQAYGRVHVLTVRLQALSQNGHDPTKEAGHASRVLKSLEASGLGNFSLDQWNDFIALRMRLPTTISTVMQACQFNMCAGRIRVKSHDFKMASRLDPRCPWSMVALLLSQYVGNIKKGQPSDRCRASTFEGRTETVARKLPQDQVNELVSEPGCVASMETFIKEMLTTYKGIEPISSSQKPKLTNCRGAFLSDCGNSLLKVSAALDKHAKFCTQRRQAQDLSYRDNLVREQSKDQFASLEYAFRNALLRDGIYARPDALPPVIHELPAGHKGNESAPSHETETDGDAQCPDGLTNQYIYDRLCIKGCGETVMALLPPKKYSGSEDRGENRGCTRCCGHARGRRYGLDGCKPIWWRYVGNRHARSSDTTRCRCLDTQGCVGGYPRSDSGCE